MQLALLEGFLDSCFCRNDRKRSGNDRKRNGNDRLGVHVFCLVCHSRESGNPEEELSIVIFSYAFALMARVMQ
ncbi:MAG: hypothetical protein HQK96_00620 [Nitrospirae bacterium]|nr:hypothetical protein [Nitrospirota bacterium]